MYFVTVSAAYLLERDSLRGVPQGMAAVRFETILRPDGQDCQQQLG
jgi:hypothetical protein